MYDQAILIDSEFINAYNNKGIAININRKLAKKLKKIRISHCDVWSGNQNRP